MKNELIVLFASLGGVSIAGIVSILVTKMRIIHEKEQEEKREFLKRYEKIWRHLSKINYITGLTNFNLLLNQTHDLPLDAKNLGGLVPLEELRMTVEIYVPTLSKKVDEINLLWIELSKSVSDALTVEVLTNDKKKAIILNAIEQTAKIASLTQSAKKDIYKLAAKYTK